MSSLEDRLVAGIDAKRAAEALKAKKAAAEAPFTDEKTMGRARELAALRRKESLSIDDPFFAAIPRKRRAADKAYVREMKQKFAEEETVESARMTELASAFEYVVARRINDSGWLGDDMRAQLTAERDDFHNGIDMYVERNGKPIGLSFDITFTRDPARLTRKIQGVKERMLDRGKLAQLEYYMPLDAKKRAEMGASDGYSIALPKVVIGVSRDEMLTAVNRYYDNRDAKPDAPSGLIMLHQIKYQLAHFIRYCKASAEQNPGAMKAVPAYTRALAEVERVWEEKIRSLNLDEARVEAYVRNDPFTKNLRESLDKILPTGDT